MKLSISTYVHKANQNIYFYSIHSMERKKGLILPHHEFMITQHTWRAHTRWKPKVKFVKWWNIAICGQGMETKHFGNHKSFLGKVNTKYNQKLKLYWKLCNQQLSISYNTDDTRTSVFGIGLGVVWIFTVWYDTQNSCFQ